MIELWQQGSLSGSASLAAILTDDRRATRLRQVLRSATGSRHSNQELLDRLEHFEIEDRLIRSLPATIDESAVGHVGELVNQSQQAAERLLRNQTRETVHLVRSAMRLGAYAASAFGAGFGGSVWALIDSADEFRFQNQWRDEYAAEFPHLASKVTFFATLAAPPAQIWDGTEHQKP
jgi:galactokinase